MLVVEKLGLLNEGRVWKAQESLFDSLRSTIDVDNEVNVLRLN